MSEPITPQQDHDRRIGRLEGIAEQLDRRLDDLQRTMTARMDALERAIADLRATNRWIIGILFGVVGLQLTILLKVLN
ncbi:MAG: hypothetical protein F4Z85_12585 [Gemmatimonadetes bacterium]|nr:hypothetical protein [Gemmatimonadota bacterium]MYB69245.1 hypothetical protein [Gemmatimonadota bacterium]